MSRFTMASLTDQYNQVIATWEDVIEGLSQKITTSQNENFDKVAKNVKKFLENGLSMFLSWGSDIRVDSGLLESLGNTIQKVLLQVTLNDIRDILMSWDIDGPVALG